MKKRISNSLLHIFLIAFCVSAFSQEYGLSFYGHEVLKDQRTGLILSPDKQFNFKNEFELSFDLAIQQSEIFRYGYVFRIILNGETNIDLIYGTRARGNSDFSIIKGKNETEIAFNRLPPSGDDNWINIKIRFLLRDDKIILYENENVYIDSLVDLQANSELSISFGACSYENFVSIDVPPIMIRDVRLLGDGGKNQYHWPLDQYEGEVAFDILDKKEARIVNPNWLRRTHLNWTAIQEINLDGFVKPVKNQKEEKIYFLAEEVLLVYDARNGRLDTVFYNKKPGFIVRNGQAVYDHQTGMIINYNVDGQQVFSVDPLTGEISDNIFEPDARKDYLHHNKHLNEVDSSVYIFNGYGHYFYKNRIFRCKIGSGQWDTIQAKGDLPAPRYLAASGFLNDTIYFLGGYGSESGNQKLSPQHFYDLYAFSLKDFHYRKLNSFPDPPEDYCFSNSMVIDPLNRNYYALSFPDLKYNTQLQLVRGSLDKGSLDPMGNQIPYLFNDINSFADLYYFPKSEKMYAVTTLNEEGVGTEVSLYSIGYPPITRQTSLNPALQLKERNYFLIGLAAFLFLMLFWLFIKFKRMRLGRIVSSAEQSTEDELINVQTTSKRLNALYYFGGFQVISKTGADITNKFTPLLKELFLIIILHSIKNEKGISSARIVELLWFDKSERNARNNLSVNITKLKHVLEDMEECELTNETGYWKIHQGKDIYNEYCEVEAIVNSKKNINQEMILRLIEITAKGSFLLNLDFEWLDVFKGKISDRITDALLTYAKSLDIKENAEQIIDLADCLFNFDVVNEEIMILKCKAQYGQGKHSLARNTYKNFCSEYKILYGEDYLNSFNDIINSRHI